MNRARPEDDPTPHGRSVPHDHTAEAALIGAAMLSTSALEVLATQTRPDDFYRPAHQHVAASLTRAYDEGWPADPVTVANDLQRAGLLEDVGGRSQLIGMYEATASTSNAAEYARIIHDHATLRRLIGVAGEIAELGYGLTTEVHDAVTNAQELLSDVAANNGTRSYSNLAIPDVAALLAGDLPQVEADFLTRTDAKALLYAGKMHVFQAEPSVGKTWLALLACVEILTVGGACLYLDYEDTVEGIIGRLLALGAEPAAVADQFVYIRPDGPFGPAEKTELGARVAQLNPDLVIIDGVAEALTRDGYSEDKASEVVTWTEKLPRWLTRTGAAVVMLDHLVKDREQQGRYARGSGSKLGAVDGATYTVKVTGAFSRHKSGTLKLIIAKDRPGGVGAIGETAAIAHIEPHGDGARVVIRLDAPTEQISVTDAWKPTAVMEMVSREIENSAAKLSAREVKAIVKAKPNNVEQAITRLRAEGFIRATAMGSTTVLASIKPYRSPAADDPSAPPSQDEPPARYPHDPYEADRHLFADLEPQHGGTT